MFKPEVRRLYAATDTRENTGLESAASEVVLTLRLIVLRRVISGEIVSPLSTRQKSQIDSTHITEKFQTGSSFANATPHERTPEEV